MIKTWQQRCEEHPDHDGIVTNQMIQARMQEEIDELRAAIEQANAGEASDGYHTFNELYAFRKAYNAALFNELAANGKCSVHKSWRHYDGELCFGGGWFIVVAMLPSGQISNHYEAKDWDLFKVPAAERAMFPFDGHTEADVVARLSSYAPAQTPIEQAQPQTVPAESGLAEKVPATGTHLETIVRKEFDRIYEEQDPRRWEDQEPVAWQDHVEQRLLTWRQRFVNKNGDQLALDDFMDKRSLDDLIDFVCDEYTDPPNRKPPRFPTMLRKMWSGSEVQKWIDENWEKTHE